MKVLFDTNIVLDVILAREPFWEVASQLTARVEQKDIEGFLGATTLTTVHYLVAKAEDRDRALTAIRRLLGLFQIARIDHSVLERAALSPIEDFEDAVLHEAAKAEALDAIVTRNRKDFRQATILILAPEELEAFLATAAPRREPL